VTVKQKTSEPDQVPAADRRDQPRGSLDSDSWETIVLRRVARHAEYFVVVSHFRLPVREVAEIVSDALSAPGRPRRATG
jgi:hypothetical protein